jgi:hypothetical protein
LGRSQSNVFCNLGFTLAEEGLPNYDVSAWTGLFIPAGKPRAIINRLNDETGKISHDRAYVARILGMATEVVAVSTPEAFGAFVRDNVARWNKVIDGAGISPGSNDTPTRRLTAAGAQHLGAKHMNSAETRPETANGNHQRVRKYSSIQAAEALA